MGYLLEGAMIDIRIGDCRQFIHDLENESLDCVMTSPPYWGLRDYGHPDQIGLEATPEEYLKTMLDFFDDVKIKLKAEGNCFVNLGDTYSGSGCGTNDYRTEKSKSINGKGKNAVMYKTGGIAQKIKSIPAKSLCMIPQRFAWGMIERGWILRNEKLGIVNGKEVTKKTYIVDGNFGWFYQEHKDKFHKWFTSAQVKS